MTGTHASTQVSGTCNTISPQ